MKIILLLTLLHFGAAFGLDAPPEPVSFRRILVNARPAEQPERALTQSSPQTIKVAYNAQNFREDLTKVFAELGLGMVQDSKPEVIRASMTVGKGTNLIFECLLKQSMKEGTNLVRTYIICSNRPPSKGSQPPQPMSSAQGQRPQPHPFTIFANHHAVYSRAVSKEDSPAQLAFLRDSAKKLKEIAATVLTPVNVDKLFELVQRIVGSGGYNDIEIKPKWTNTNCIGFDLFDKSSSLKVYQVIIYTIDRAFLGMDFAIYDQSHLAIVSRLDVASAEPDIKKILDGRPRGEQLKRLKVDDFPEKIGSYISSQCPNDKQTIETGVKILGPAGEKSTFVEVRAKRTSGVKPAQEACPYADSTFLVTYFHYGSFQSFEMQYESKEMEYETLLLADKAKFDVRFEEVMKFIRENEDLVKKSHAESTMEVFVTVDGLAEALGKGLGDTADAKGAQPLQPASFPPDRLTPIITYHFESINVEAIVNRTPDEFVIQLSMKKTDKYTPVHGEITVPLANGYDYKPVVEKNARDFIQKANEEIKEQKVKAD